MEIRYSKSAVKVINGMTSSNKKRIKAGIIGLTKKHPESDIKSLKGYSDGRFRLRVGQYRIIHKYSVEKQLEILHILKIGSRGDVYK